MSKQCAKEAVTVIALNGWIALYRWIGKYDFTQGCIYPPRDKFIPTAAIATHAHNIMKLEDSLRIVHLRASIPP